VGARPRAFSLLELTLVLVIMAVAAGLVAPAIDGGLRSRRVWLATRQFAATLRHLRGEAVATGTMREIVIDPRRNAYQATGWTEVVNLPAAASFAAVQGGLVSGDQLVRAFFFPNGGTTGLRVVLATSADPTRARFRITLDPLIGAVGVEDDRA
jgi:general secretion pathway protein H